MYNISRFSIAPLEVPLFESKIVDIFKFPQFSIALAKSALLLMNLEWVMFMFASFSLYTAPAEESGSVTSLLSNIVLFISTFAKLWIAAPSPSWVFSIKEELSILAIPLPM